MGRLLDRKAADALMERLQEQYDVYAPRLFQGTGCFSDTDVVRYGRIDSLMKSSGTENRNTALRRRCFRFQIRFSILRRMR